MTIICGVLLMFEYLQYVQIFSAFSALLLLVGNPACKNFCFQKPLGWWLMEESRVQPEVPCGCEEFWPVL